MIKVICLQTDKSFIEDLGIYSADLPEKAHRKKSVEAPIFEGLNRREL